MDGGVNKLADGVSFAQGFWAEYMGTLLLVMVVLFATDRVSSSSGSKRRRRMREDAISMVRLRLANPLCPYLMMICFFFSSSSSSSSFSS